MSKHDWIPITKQLPKKGEYVLFYYDKNSRNPTLYATNTMAVGKYEHRLFFCEGCVVSITHWMPLPKPPTEQEGSHEPT